MGINFSIRYLVSPWCDLSFDKFGHSGLLGNLSLLSGSRLDAEQRQFVRNMDVSGRILLKHVDSVLDIARFEAGKVQLSLERLNLSELLQNLVDGPDSDFSDLGF